MSCSLWTILIDMGTLSFSYSRTYNYEHMNNTDQGRIQKIQRFKEGAEDIVARAQAPFPQLPPRAVRFVEILHTAFSEHLWSKVKASEEQKGVGATSGPFSIHPCGHLYVSTESSPGPEKPELI